MSEPGETPTSSDAHHERLTRIEESVAFGEHATEQHAEEIAAIAEAVRKLAARMDRLETRLGGMFTDQPDTNAAPRRTSELDDTQDQA